MDARLSFHAGCQLAWLSVLLLAACGRGSGPTNADNGTGSVTTASQTPSAVGSSTSANLANGSVAPEAPAPAPAAPPPTVPAVTPDFVAGKWADAPCRQNVQECVQLIRSGAALSPNCGYGALEFFLDGTMRTSSGTMGANWRLSGNQLTLMGMDANRNVLWVLQPLSANGLFIAGSTGTYLMVRCPS
jgi:hypothetical protein